MNPLRARFQFEWGDLDDGTIWVRTPTRSVFRIGRDALRLVLDLDGGRTREAVARRYRITAQELEGILRPFLEGGAVLSEGFGRIRRAAPVDDIAFAPWLALAVALLVLQADFLARHARTAVLDSWVDGGIVILFGIAAAFVHEAGHWAASRPFFSPRVGLTWLGWFPAVYADTHEAWCLPRGHRLRISAAGCLTDLVVNTGAVLLAVQLPELERYATPFLLAQYSRWALTLNPFFDGDGYWLLADALGVTNLRTTARKRLSEGRRDLMSLFALVSIVFGALSLVGVLLLLWNFAGNLLVASGLVNLSQP